MLTRDDLQQIRGIVDEVVNKVVKKVVKDEFTKYDRKVTKKLNVIIDSLDTHIVDHEHRIRRIEGKLQLPSMN